MVMWSNPLITASHTWKNESSSDSSSVSYKVPSEEQERGINTLDTNIHSLLGLGPCDRSGPAYCSGANGVRLQREGVRCDTSSPETSDDVWLTLAVGGCRMMDGREGDVASRV